KAFVAAHYVFGLAVGALLARPYKGPVLLALPAPAGLPAAVCGARSVRVGVGPRPRRDAAPPGAQRGLAAPAAPGLGARGGGGGALGAVGAGVGRRQPRSAALRSRGSDARAVLALASGGGPRRDGAVGLADRPALPGDAARLPRLASALQRSLVLHRAERPVA